jgi:hydrogenase 3 maturation protease
VAVVGIGNSLRGDDGAGSAFIRALRRMTPRIPTSVLLVDAGTAPENFTGPLRQFQPTLVLLIDAAQLNETPGTIRLLDAMQATGLDASTHTLPLSLTARYLTRAVGCEIAILGIQPADNAYGAPLSPRVRRAVQRAAREFAVLLSRL